MECACIALVSTTTKLCMPVRQGYADVADFELVALQVVSGQCAMRRGRAPAAAEDEEGVLQVRLNRHLQQYLFLAVLLIVS